MTSQVCRLLIKGMLQSGLDLFHDITINGQPKLALVQASETEHVVIIHTWLLSWLVQPDHHRRPATASAGAGKLAILGRLCYACMLAMRCTCSKLDYNRATRSPSTAS